jgi:molybdate transport system substrate-binding protein
MRCLTRFRLLAGISVLLAFSHPLRAEEPVTLFAAASTAPAIEDIARLYEAEHRGTIRTVFASSGVLARQIYNGAPADLFISANPDWMNWLVERGAIDGTPVTLLSNRLVLIQHTRQSGLLRLDENLPEALDGGRLAIGDPAHVPAGIYAREALQSLGLWTRLAPLTVRTRDVRAALFLVSRGEAVAGIVYASDLAFSKNIRLATYFPAESHAPLLYPAGILAAGDRAAARKLLDFLRTSEVVDIFDRHGFRME